MEARGEERVQEGQCSFPSPRVLLILAAAVFLFGAVALAFGSVDAALGASSTVRMYQNGWSVGTMAFVLAGNAIYLPGVVLALASLGLAQSGSTRGRAAKITRPLFVLAVAMILVGVGKATCAVGSDYYGQHETLAWSTAQKVLGQLVRSVFDAGILAGLAYLCLRQVGSADSREANNLD
jgi:hypothetical protein